MKIVARLSLLCVSLIFLCFALTGQSSAGIEKIAGAWLFDEGSGTVAKDSSGNDNHGEFMGNPQWVDGKVGKALELGGVEDYLDLGEAKSLEFTDEDFSIVAWVNLYSESERFCGMIFARGAWTPGGYLFGVGWGTAIRFETENNGEKAVQTNAGVVPINEWVHLAVVKSGATAELYKDGDSVLEGPVYEELGRYDGHALIGTYVDVNRDGSALHGMIDDVAISTQALTEDDIKTIMTEGLGEVLGLLAVSRSGKLTSTWAEIKAK